MIPQTMGKALPDAWLLMGSMGGSALIDGKSRVMRPRMRLTARQTVEEFRWGLWKEESCSSAHLFEIILQTW